MVDWIWFLITIVVPFKCFSISRMGLKSKKEVQLGFLEPHELTICELV